jgi:hypothetical protein
MSTPANLASCRVFIIHGDSVLGSTLASACEHRGARIAGIHGNAEHALQALSLDALAHHGDVIAILDSALIDAARVAQALADRGVPFLVIAKAGDVGTGPSGAAAILTSPVSREDLMAAVADLCRAVDRQ